MTKKEDGRERCLKNYHRRGTFGDTEKGEQQMNITEPSE